MIIERIIYTNVHGKKETKKAIQKNAKRKHFDFDMFVPLNNIKGKKDQHILEQLYAIYDSKKQKCESVLVVDGKTIFDFSPQALSLPPDDYDIVFLNGDIEEYVYPTDEVMKERQQALDKLYEEEMERKWGPQWKEWLDWWNTWNEEIESEFQSEGDKEVQRKATNDEIMERWEEWFSTHETNNKILRNVKDADLITNQYYRYLFALKDGRTDVERPELDYDSDEDEETADPWLRWMNLNIREGNESPVYKGESGLWFSAKMKTSSAYVVNGHNDNMFTIFKKGKEYFAESENNGKTMAEFLCSLGLKTYVINRSMCGKETETTPESLDSFDLTEQVLERYSDEDLPKISVISPVFNNEDGFFLTMMSFQLQDYPEEKIEWVIVDDSTPGRDIQRMIPEKERRIRYLRCSVKEGKRLTFGRKLNIGCKNATNDIMIPFTEGMYYPPTSLRARVVSLLESPKKFEFVGCTRMGFYNVKNDTSFTVQLQDTNDNPTVYHQDTVAFTRSFWTRRLFHEGLVNDFYHNIICIPFTMERYSLVLDIPFDLVAVKIDTANREIPDNEKHASFRQGFASSFREALIMLEREKTEYSRDLEMSQAEEDDSFTGQTQDETEISSSALASSSEISL